MIPMIIDIGISIMELIEKFDPVVAMLVNEVNSTITKISSTEAPANIN